MHIHRELDRNSYVGRLYFWYFERSGYYRSPPTREDTCGVRKILLLALARGFFIYRILDTRVKPWMFGASLAFAWLSWAFPVAMAWVLVGSFLVVVVALTVVAAFVLLMYTVWSLGKGIKWLNKPLVRVEKFVLNLLLTSIEWVVKWISERLKTLRGPWWWFWNHEIVHDWVYPWTIAYLGLQVVSGYLALKGLGRGAFTVLFWTLTALELLVVLVILVISYKDWAEEHAVGARISAPFRTAGYRISIPVEGSFGILRQLWKSLKGRVCVPVVWV